VSVEEIVLRLERLLEEERAAIRALDGSSIERTAREKESLANELRASPRDELARQALLLRELSANLRRNAILLAHARDLLRDVLAAARGIVAEARAARSATASPYVTPGARVSRTV
jgi:hypothetical protein